jgi:Family of unknown function (DUF6703)
VPARTRNLLAAAVVGGTFVAGLFLHGVAGAVLLIVVAAVLALLTGATWGHIPSNGRPLRVLIIAAVIAVAVLKLVKS